VITFDTREPAPLSVRWARVIVPLFLCFAYLTFRLGPATHDRVPLSELLASGVLFVGLTFVAFIALGDLLCPATPAERAFEDDPESTGVFARFTDGTRPGWGAFAGELPGPGTWAMELRELAAADLPTEEFELLTHEYRPQHHTPARGFVAVSVDPAGEPFAMVGIDDRGRVHGIVPAPAPRTTGRHRRVSQ
jgi:hypothetical protein